MTICLSLAVAALVLACVWLDGLNEGLARALERKGEPPVPL